MLQAVPPVSGGKEEQANEQRLEREQAWDAATEKYDANPGEEVDTTADDGEPSEEEPSAQQLAEPLCPSLSDVLKRSQCKPGNACEKEVKAQFDAMDLNKDGKLCPGEVEGKFEEQEAAPIRDQTGASMLEVTRQRLAGIKELFDAGKLDNATHMGMLVELFNDPQHLGTGLTGEEDLPGFTSLLGGEGSLAEGQPAADGTVVNRTVYHGPPQRLEGTGVAMLGWPVDADLDGDGRLSADEYRQARQARAGRGVSLLETGRLAAEFTSTDLDGNGLLEMDELKGSLYERSSKADAAVNFRTPAYYYGAGECSATNPQWVGDGWCDHAYNNEACMWDGGDCCQETCSKAAYDCGRAGYRCQAGAVEMYRARQPYFPSPGLDVHTFRALWAWARAKLAGGCASWQGESLSVPEWVNLMRAFNRGTTIQDKAKCNQGCGNNMCGWVDSYRQAGGKFGGGVRLHREFGTGLCSRTGSYTTGDWEKALFIHEMAHNAGYGHPGYSGKEEWGSCHAVGSWYDHCNGDRCKIASQSCETHWHGNSQGCGFWGLGCQAKCVKAEYSMSMPERAPWCTRVRRGARCESQ